MDNVGAALYVTEMMPNVKRIAGINQNYAWGQDSWNDFEAAMKALKPDVEVTTSQMPKLLAGQYGAEISALMAGRPDVIHSSFWGGDLDAFVLQAVPRGALKKSTAVLTAGETATHKLGGQIPDGTIIGARGPHGAFAPDNELNRWFRTAYQDRFVLSPNYPAYHMAQALLGLKSAYEKAQGGGAAPEPGPGHRRVRGAELRDAEREDRDGARQGPPGGRADRLRHVEGGGRQAHLRQGEAVPGGAGEPARGREERRLDQDLPEAGREVRPMPRAREAQHAVSTLVAILVDGIIYASWLFIIAAGLTLIYGVMRILNMAHGSLYALGAYVAASLAGAWLRSGLPPLGSYAVLAASAILVGLVVGPLIERGLLRFMYGRDEVVMVLVTYALFLILEDVIKLVWGVESYFVSEPYGLLGNLELGDLSYPVYSAVLVVVAIAVGLGLRFGIYGTRRGKLLLAVIHDREVSAALGINVRTVFLVTFTLGTMLAAIGGALTAPTVSVVPGMGVEVIVLAFAVVVIGGLGSMPGAALGALIVGIVRSSAVHLLPEVELFSIYLVMALVLAFRPRGLFVAAEARKI